jgi:hypothetical protein
LLTAGELFDEAGVIPEAVRVYERYVEEYPRPLNVAMETRTRLAEIFKAERVDDRYREQLGAIVAMDTAAGAERTDRSRYLAGQAALVLAEARYETFASVRLVQPFEETLAEKQRLMDEALIDFEILTTYQVADVTAAATYYIAETYYEFSNALLTSERPSGLSEAEKLDYEMVIEEQAYPFEEQAIEVHQKNFELLAGGLYNPWVQQSLDKLVDLMPGRYARNEISGGYLGSIDTYAYRMPIAPPPGVDPLSPMDDEESANDERSAEVAAKVSE